MCCTAASRWICCCRGFSPGCTDTLPDGERSDRQRSSQTHRPSPNTPLTTVKSFHQIQFCCSVHHRLILPVQLFSVQFHTPPTHTLKTHSRLAAHWQILSLQWHTLTTHCILAEAHVLVNTMFRGIHTGTELQRCTFHCEEWGLRERKHETKQ